MNQRSWEMVDWIQRAFTEPAMFSHHGRFYDIPDMTFTTKPVQQPLPMWWGGMGPKNLARAAERGMNLIAPFNAGYDAALRGMRSQSGRLPVSVMVPVCVADTADKAWEIAGPGIEYFVNFYQMRKNLQGEPAPAEARVTQEMLRSGNAGFWFAAVGTPEDVVGKLRPFVDGHLGRITQLALQMRQPGMSNDRHPPLDAHVRQRSHPRAVVVRVRPHAAREPEPAIPLPLAKNPHRARNPNSQFHSRAQEPPPGAKPEAADSIPTPKPVTGHNAGRRRVIPRRSPLTVARMPPPPRTRELAHRARSDRTSSHAQYSHRSDPVAFHPRPSPFTGRDTGHRPRNPRPRTKLR